MPLQAQPHIHLEGMQTASVLKNEGRLLADSSAIGRIYVSKRSDALSIVWAHTSLLDSPDNQRLSMLPTNAARR